MSRTADVRTNEPAVRHTTPGRVNDHELAINVWEAQGVRLHVVSCFCLHIVSC